MNFDYTAIANQLKVELARHQGLANAAAALEQLGSLAAHKDTLEAQHAELSAAVDSHMTLLDKLKAGVESAKNEAVYIAEMAKAEAAKLAGEAEAAVRTRVEQLEADCHAVADSAREEAHKLVEAARTSAAAVAETIAAAQKDLAYLVEQVAGKKAELETATTALESVKAQASKIFG